MSKVTFSSVRLFTLPFIVLAALAGCSSDDPAKSETDAQIVELDLEDCYFPDVSDTKAPGWVCDHPVKGLQLQAVGSAEKSGAGFDYMKQMAAASARVQLAQALRVQTSNLIKQYAGVTGVGDAETVDKATSSTTELLTNETLKGSKIFATVISPEGQLYVLVGMDPKVAAMVTEGALTTSMNNQSALWQQFKAENSHEQLAKKIANQGVPMGELETVSE